MPSPTPILPPIEKTAILLIDPYNDFIHPSGKLHSLLAESLQSSNAIVHILSLLTAARKPKIPVYYGLHQPFKASSFAGWKHKKGVHESQEEGRVFEEGSWGERIFAGMEPVFGNGDVVVSKHWSSSSFQNTDLDYHLHQREITHVVLAGFTTNHCVEATGRYAYDLGYETTFLSDATAGFGTELKDVATDLIWPLFANNVITTDEFIGTLSRGGKE
ncbi:hypothetical protein Vi05172_g11447 [Venturia inaequalis]|nr:hypothetical protein Vi05172_g11447 [Venturia inaequalis]